MKLLLDWDFYVYQMAWACQTHPKDEFGHITDHEAWELKPLSYAYVALHSLVKSVCARYETRDYTGYLSVADGSKNFRKILYPDYKMNRRVLDKPMYYHDIRQHIQERYPCEMADEDIEADDALGIHHAKSRDTVLISVDKDMRMIPGTLYISTTKDEVKVSDPGHLQMIKKEKGGNQIKGYGFKWFAAQMLLGDKADNIPQLKRGFSDVGVYKYLKSANTVSTIWDKVAELYGEEGKSEEDLLRQAKLLWIMREPGQIFEKEIISELAKEEKRRQI